MKIEMTISEAAACATMALIHEYLADGGSGVDAEALSEMMDALGNADRIVIADKKAE
jgi:hypothetical protein